MTQIGNWPYLSWIVVPIPSDIYTHNLTYNWLFGLEYFQTNIQSTPYMSQSGQYPATAYVTNDYSNQDRIDVIDSIVSGVIPASVSSVRPLPYSWDYFNDETMSLEQITVTEEQVFLSALRNGLLRTCKGRAAQTTSMMLWKPTLGTSIS